MSGVIKVGVLDDQEVVRNGVRAHLADQPGIVLCGEYAQATYAQHAVAQGRVDVLLMACGVDNNEVLELIKALRHASPEVRLLAFLAEPWPEVVGLLLAAGVHGIVCKRQPLDLCVQAIRVLASGQHYICASLVQAEGQDDPGIWWESIGAEEALASSAALSQREREVLRLCIKGLTVTRIAEQFNRSLKTVSTQKLAAYRKLGVKNDMDLFRRLSQYNGSKNF